MVTTMNYDTCLTSVLEAGETAKCMVTTTNYELILPWLAKRKHTGVIKKAQTWLPCKRYTTRHNEALSCKPSAHLQAIQPSAAVVATGMRMCNCTILRNMQRDHALA